MSDTLTEFKILSLHGGRTVQVDANHRLVLRRWKPQHKGGYWPLGFALGSLAYDDQYHWQVLALNARGGSPKFIATLHRACKALWAAAEEAGEVTNADSFRDAAGARP